MKILTKSLFIVPLLTAVLLFLACSEKKSEEHLGLFRNGAWNWFSAGELGVSPLAGGIQAIKGGALYCTMDPYLLKNFPKELLPFLQDKNVLSSIPEDGNTVITIIKLKQKSS